MKTPKPNLFGVIIGLLKVLLACNDVDELFK